MTEHIDVNTLTDAQLQQAIIHNGNKWGSFGYYIANEVNQALADRAGVTVYRDVDGQLRAFYKTPEQRRKDAEVAAWKPGMPPVSG